MIIEKNRSGYEATYVHGATVTDLSRFLNPDVPFVWILGHMPHPIIEWWQASVPLNLSHQVKAKIRLLSYDIQMSTEAFLGIQDQFLEGIDLVQATREMPNSLNLSRVPEEQQDTVIFKNGGFLRISLPHAVETAYVVCYRPGYLEKTANKT